MKSRTGIIPCVNIFIDSNNIFLILPPPPKKKKSDRRKINISEFPKEND